jgi:hypothetical protein
MFMGLGQIEIHTQEPSAFEVEMANENLKRHGSPGIVQIPAQLVQTGIEQFILRSINLLSLE